MHPRVPHLITKIIRSAVECNGKTVLTLWSSMHCVSWKHLEHWLSSCNRPGISCFTRRAASRFRCISRPAMSSADFMMTCKRTRWWHYGHILYCAQEHNLLLLVDFAEDQTTLYCFYLEVLLEIHGLALQSDITQFARGLLNYQSVPSSHH